MFAGGKSLRAGNEFTEKKGRRQPFFTKKIFRSE
jgi:hypothetical protein